MNPKPQSREHYRWDDMEKEASATSYNAGSLRRAHDALPCVPRQRLLVPKHSHETSSSPTSSRRTPLHSRRRQTSGDSECRRSAAHPVESPPMAEASRILSTSTCQPPGGLSTRPTPTFVDRSWTRPEGQSRIRCCRKQGTWTRSRRGARCEGVDLFLALAVKTVVKSATRLRARVESVSRR